MEAVIAELERGLENSEKERIRVRDDALKKWSKCEMKFLEQKTLTNVYRKKLEGHEK